MSFTSGTATDHNDLLDLLRLYLVAEGWTELAWTAGATVLDPSTLHVRGPGAGAGKQVFVSIETSGDDVVPFYSWDMRSAVDYDGTLEWGGQLGQSPPVYLNLWDGPIDYWFFVNDRRFVVVAKCSTNYMSAHAGFFLPWGTPAQYPFPLYLAADYTEPAPFSLANSARRMCVDPGAPASNGMSSAAYARTATGVWYPIINHIASARNNAPEGADKGARGFLWPYHAGTQYSQPLNQAHYPIYWTGGDDAADFAWAFESLVPTQQDERPLMPAMIGMTDQSPLGVLDGVYAVGGQGLATEQLITIAARDFRVFQNIARNSGDDFFCVEEI